jgi:hypothetical protein
MIVQSQSRTLAARQHKPNGWLAIQNRGDDQTAFVTLSGQSCSIRVQSAVTGQSHHSHPYFA